MIRSGLGVYGPDNGFGVYIHWPYCTKICPYCDFNVYSARHADDASLLNAMVLDIERQARELADHPALTSIYLGGGTPSLLNPSQIAELIGQCEDNLGLSRDAEITLEANPIDILRSDLEGWRSAGVNRVSLGVQSLRNDALAFLGRDHDADAALKALATLADVFDNVSADLIYARPGQALSDWTAELQLILSNGVKHISLYELTIAEGTAFGRAAKRGSLVPMPEEDQARLYEATNALMEASGLPAYEVSNHAASAKFESLHNHIYWASGDWLGIGPGAHGRLTRDTVREAIFSYRKPRDYIQQIADGKTGIETADPLTQQDTAMEALSMGLRRSDGVDYVSIESLLGRELDVMNMVEFEEQHLIERHGPRLRLTAEGRLLADYVTHRLL